MKIGGVFVPKGDLFLGVLWVFILFYFLFMGDWAFALMGFAFLLAHATIVVQADLIRLQRGVMAALVVEIVRLKEKV